MQLGLNEQGFLSLWESGLLHVYATPTYPYLFKLVQTCPILPWFFANCNAGSKVVCVLKDSGFVLFLRRKHLRSDISPDFVWYCYIECFFLNLSCFVFLFYHFSSFLFTLFSGALLLLGLLVGPWHHCLIIAWSCCHLICRDHL